MIKADTKIEIVEQGEKMDWAKFYSNNRPFISDEAYNNMLSALSEKGKFVYEAGTTRLTLRVVK